ncbi:MAG TPA: class I SAM-dependent methyltransferase [Anaerolinea sp.]|nr:class I SAM-dependent methyltransferase [Anaerolinea sp.]
MSDTDLTIQRLMEANPLREPLLRSIVGSLNLPAASRGLDVGCGIGHQALLLAEALGPGGQVTGVDISPALLQVGERLAAEAGFSAQVTFREGDMYHLPFSDQTFDWVWSADCVGYPAGDLARVLAELARVARPGGSIHLLAWTSQQVLPGYPLLEARLNATNSSYQPYLQAQAPDTHFARSAHWLRQAGLEDVRVRTFVGDVQAPLSYGVRGALIALFEMLWGGKQPETTLADWEACRRLCDPESADFILDLADYYAFFTYTLVSGRLASTKT